MTPKVTMCTCVKKMVYFSDSLKGGNVKSIEQNDNFDFDIQVSQLEKNLHARRNHARAESHNPRTVRSLNKYFIKSDHLKFPQRSNV